MSRIKSSMILILGLAISAHHASAQDNDRDENVEERVPDRNIGNEDSDFSPDIKMGIPMMAGSGCPQGTGSITLSPDNKQLSVLFDQFVVEAGKGTAVRQEKNCTLRIPVQVPAGFKASIVRIDYRGFNSIPVGGRVVLANSFSLNGSINNGRGNRRDRLGDTRAQKVFRGPLVEDFSVTTRARSERRHENDCGESFELAMNTVLRAVSNRQLEHTSAALDSIDAAANPDIRYAIRWKRCQANGRGGDGSDPRRENDDRGGGRGGGRGGRG
jgi:hypothetical protein